MRKMKLLKVLRSRRSSFLLFVFVYLPLKVKPACREAPQPPNHPSNRQARSEEMAPLPGTEPPELERSKVFKDTKWLYYCLCEGCGIGPFSDPLIAAETKELCLRSSVSTTDISGEDGLCNQTEVCLCMTEHCQLPPLEGAPTCACFNMKFGGSMGSTKWKATLFEQSKIMDDTFWVYYFICAGCGVNKMDQGLFSAEFKELCCRGYTNIEPPIIDGVLCSSVGTECCIWSECQLPPAQGNPMCAICTWRLKK